MYSTGLSSNGPAGTPRTAGLDAALRSPRSSGSYAPRGDPGQWQQPTHVSPQGIQEVDDLGAHDPSVVQAEVEVGEDDPLHCRQLVPVEAVVEYRRLPYGRPQAHPVRTLAHSAFINENDRAAWWAGSFPSVAGHCLCCHCRMAASFCSRARRSGR